MTARSAVDFPEPDSPTSPTTSFACRVRVRFFIAGWRTPPTAKLTVRFSIAISGSGIGGRALEMETIAQPLAEEIEANDGGADGQGRAEERPEGDANVLLRFVDHDSPVRVRWLSAEAEIAERGPPHQGEADIDAALHDDGRPHAGENLAVLDIQRALPAGAGRGDVVVARGVEHGAAHEADDDVEGEDEGGNGEERVDEAHDDLVEPAAIEAGGERDGQADGETERGRPETEGDGAPASRERPAQHVAPEPIGAEEVRATGRGEPMQQVDLRRCVRAVREPEEGDSEGEHGQACAEREIEVDAPQRWDGGGDELVHGRAMRGLSAAWARSARRLAAT